VAATILLAPEAHRGQIYEMTGPEALTMAEIAAMLTRRMGKPIRFHDETVEEAYESRAIYGAPKWQVDAWVSTYTAIKAGDWARVSTDVARVTGHPPMSLDALLQKGKS
jgi:NAD(P)H dehydrogenase (quinone)